MDDISLRSPKTVARELADFALSAVPSEAATAVCRRLLFDIVGLAIAARQTDYVAGALASAVGNGSCTIFGAQGDFTMYDAALVNGTAAHGEDFDDTFEGGPVHAGAVIVPAMLALAEQRQLSGEAVMRGIAVGAELLCRMSLVAPEATHRAGFHPTAVFGAPAATAAAGAALGMPPGAVESALGISGSLAAGIIEYLAHGSSTKRLHAGNAAQSGLRAALLGAGGFSGPATVFEGTHGFYKAFAPSKQPDFRPLTERLGQSWVIETLAFKPYACGTMTQPFVDCAIALRNRGVRAEDIERITCRVGEGTVHRLWAPLSEKHRPPNGYGGKFSTPYCMAVGFFDGQAGLKQFTDERVKDPHVLALAQKISYEVDPNDDYPRNFSGHLRALMKDGSVHEIRQPHMRGGAHEPLSDAEIMQKFRANMLFGGAAPEQIDAVAEALEAIAAGGKVDLGAARL